jgi:hypothetical protein
MMNSCLHLFAKPRCIPFATARVLSTTLDAPLYNIKTPQISEDTNKPAKEEKDELALQRSIFEDALKFGASNLSNKTDGTTLVYLLRTTAFLDNQELAGRLLDYLRNKLSTLSNEELGQVYASLVLVSKVKDEGSSKMGSLLKVMEYLTLRRVHSLEPRDLVKIFSSYSYLCAQQKCPVSSSFIKTFEYVIVNKVHLIAQDELAKCIGSLIRLQ